MSDEDVLSKLTPKQVADFYRRLANSTADRFGKDSLASLLMLHWLDGKGRKKIYEASYVKDLSETRDYLKNTARPMFLSQKSFRGKPVGGVVPRLRNGILHHEPLHQYKMQLEGNAEVPVIGTQSLLSFLWPSAGNKREMDALYALHGYTVCSNVKVTATEIAQTHRFNIRFDSWECKVVDFYHWNPDLHITVPNPDVGSLSKDAVAPGSVRVTVYHRNAIRVEQAGLAHSFVDESKPWREADPDVVGPAIVGIG